MIDRFHTKFPGRHAFRLVSALFGCACLLAGRLPAAPLPAGVPVHGWTILSGSEPGALDVIAAAPAYGINHLGLSQELISNLNEVKNDAKCAQINRLIDKAHAAGISEVVVWDRALYKIDYYPAEFRTGPDGTLDFDNPAFWEWLKADYRKMLDRLPKVDGVVLTFTFTPTLIDEQYSKKLKTPQEKLAAVLNTIAGVVIGERHLNFYIRIFPNDRPEDPVVNGTLSLLNRDDIRLMIKLTPLDYFLTSPDCPFIGAIPRPTVVEFDAAGEYDGQGVVANLWVEDILNRWRRLSQRPNVIGYAARTDRLADSRVIGRPGEINLLTLKRGAEDPDVTTEQVYDEFITAHYGAAALPEVKAAFKNGYDITTSVFYTLGSVLNDHSKLDYDIYTPPYGHLVSGRWLRPPVVYVRHGVNREFHYWRDVVDHLAPAFVKDPAYKQPENFVPTDDQKRWIQPGEALDEDYLRAIITEKNYGVSLAEDSVRHIDNARSALTPAAYEDLHHYFERTLLTARLQRAAASAYFGFRVWCRGKPFQTGYVHDAVQNGLTEMKAVAALIRNYPVKPPAAAYVWTRDADSADRYFQMIVQDGWPKEDQQGIPDASAGQKFPYAAP
ncbi:MAG TPA: hypothetical protein VK717_04620 [Opitutaceae bacterium]|nr:hypothetical protein [Opitutaceae bacterium]